MTGTKKKIIWLAHEGNLSGANIAMLEYVDALTDVYDFHIILPHEGNMTTALQQRNIPSTVIPQYSWAGKKGSGNFVQWLRIELRSFLAVIQTKQLIQKEEADLIFTNTQVPFTAAKAAYSLQLPHVWWIHEFGEEDFGFRIGWGKPELAYRLMEKWSQLIIGNSDAIFKKFRSVIPGATIQRVYQPVSWKPVVQVNEEKKATYLMFGQIVPSKGHREVLQAMANAKKKNKCFVSLHIKGPCENKVYLGELLEFIRLHGLQEEVQIETGFLVKEEVMPGYDVLVVASDSEAFGRVIVEANKAGLKVVVRNSGGAPELINETNGLLYQNSDELAAIFTGEKKMPEGVLRMNYSEEDELNKLKRLLAELI